MGGGLIDFVGPERSGAKAAGCRLRGMQQPVVRVRARVRVKVKVKESCHIFVMWASFAAEASASTSLLC